MFVKKSVDVFGFSTEEDIQLYKQGKRQKNGKICLFWCN